MAESRRRHRPRRERAPNPGRPRGRSPHSAVRSAAGAGRSLDVERISTRPAERTATRSESATASSTLWVTRTAVCRVTQSRPSQAQKGFAGQFVERPERLVEQEEPGMVDDRRRDVDPLLHAAGKLVGVVVQKSPKPNSRSRRSGAKTPERWQISRVSSTFRSAVREGPGRRAGRRRRSPGVGGLRPPGSPSIATVPSQAVSSPARIRSRVVLPQPEGPRSVRNSPSARSRVMSSNAETGP